MLRTVMMSLRNHLSPRLATLLMAIVIGIISFVIFSRDLSSYSSYHGDEGFWIETGKWTVQKLLIERDFSREQWWTKELRSFGAVNPNLGLVSSLGVIIWTPLNWNRYYLPAVPFYALALGFLIAKIIISYNNQTVHVAHKQNDFDSKLNTAPKS